MINRDNASIPGVEFGVNFETMTGYGDAPMPDSEFEADNALSPSPGDIPMTEAVLEAEPGAQSEQILVVTGIRVDTRFHIPKSETLAMLNGIKAKDSEAAERLIAAKLPHAYRHIMQSEEATSREDLTLSDVLDMACLAIIEAGVSADGNEKAIPRLAWDSAKKLDKFLANSRPAEDPNVYVMGEEDELSEVANGGSGESLVEDTVISQDIQEQLLKTLTDRQRYVLKHRFSLNDEPDMYLEELGEELGLTRERIRQIENDALRYIYKRHGKVDLYGNGIGSEEFYETWMPER